MLKIIVTIGATSDQASAHIVIEGTEVLENVDVPKACALLMGLTFSLNLSSSELERQAVCLTEQRKRASQTVQYLFTLIFFHRLLFWFE